MGIFFWSKQVSSVVGMGIYGLLLLASTGLLLNFKVHGINYADTNCKAATAEQRAQENRKLFVATCDTRIGWKEFMALKLWNVTGEPLRNKGLSMVNVCKGENWGKQGFLTKPLIYLQYIRTLLYSGLDSTNYHIILMDSDTFWSVTDIQSIWTKYDCARNGKNMVLSTEMSCWIGRYCTAEDMQKWYKNPETHPSYSPFANSGVIMGKLQSVATMLEYVIKNNQSYYITYHKHKFDDQFAIADYALHVAPHEVQLDFHQQIAASCSIHAPGDPPDDGWPFVCQNRTGGISLSCHIYTNLLRKQGHFSIDESSCLARRGTWEGMALREEMQTLAPDPLIWHGNGAGKQVYLGLGSNSFKCFLRKKNMTEQDHLETYG